MISLWKIFRNLSAIAGLILLYCTVSTSDYYVMELGQAEPSYIKTHLILGVLLLVPLILHVLWDMYKEGQER